MRWADILGLALAALWQQKVRTFLTTLGVVFGSFVLAASLSVGQGVQETIERELHRSDHLRKVEVRPQWQGRVSDLPKEELHVTGRMSDRKRERIRQALAERRLRFNPSGPRVPLTRERLHQLTQIEHVDAVVPQVRLYGWATLDKNTQGADVASARPEDSSLRPRIQAGRFFERADERAAAVSELLLHELGVTDDAAMETVIGKKLMLEFRAERSGAGLGLYLLKPGGTAVSKEESSALDKVKKQLPEMLKHLTLAEAERDVLRKALQELPPPSAEVYGESLPIVGVLRLPEVEEKSWRWDASHADIVLPVRLAEELFFRTPAQEERGVDEATLFVDREENVKGVLQRVEELGLNGYAQIEFIERQRLIYLLIFGAMTCIAGVALLVAALGIANTMLMSVLERTREVGIMKAVGAGNGQVQLIFLVEGAILGILGGGSGLLLGWTASIPGDRWVRSMVMRDLKVELHQALFVFPPWLVLVVLLFAILVTTLAAVYPARRAARVNPVTALRHE